MRDDYDDYRRDPGPRRDMPGDDMPPIMELERCRSWLKFSSIWAIVVCALDLVCLPCALLQLIGSNLMPQQPPQPQVQMPISPVEKMLQSIQLLSTMVFTVILLFFAIQIIRKNYSMIKTARNIWIVKSILLLTLMCAGIVNLAFTWQGLLDSPAVQKIGQDVFLVSMIAVVVGAFFWNLLETYLPAFFHHIAYKKYVALKAKYPDLDKHLDPDTLWPVGLERNGDRPDDRYRSEYDDRYPPREDDDRYRSREDDRYRSRGDDASDEW